MSNAEEKFCALDSNYFNLCAVVVYQNFGKLCLLKTDEYFSHEQSNHETTTRTEMKNTKYIKND